MNCKDCIRYIGCFEWSGGNIENDYANECPHFKNKANFQEVTRCKDCYNVEDLDGTLYCWYFNKNVYEDDFCSNGG